MEYILIFISAIFVNNIVLSQFLGICPFLGVSKKVETAMGMSAAVAFVLTIATIVTFLIQKFVLDVFGLGYLQTITFILVIAGLVQMVEIILKKVSPALYQALGVFLPLITTNCCILGVAILVIQKDYDLLTGVVLNRFIDDEGNYKEVAALFNASLEESLNNEEQKKAFAETVRRIKKNSLDDQIRRASDLNELQRLIREQAGLSSLVITLE